LLVDYCYYCLAVDYCLVVSVVVVVVVVGLAVVEYFIVDLVVGLI